MEAPGPLPTSISSPQSQGMFILWSEFTGRLDLQNPEFWFPPCKLSAPPLAGWVCTYFGWEAPSSRGSRKRVSNVLFRPPEPGHQRRRELVLWGMSRESGGISQLLMGEESWEGREGGGGTLPLQLGFKDLLPATQLIVDGTHQSLTYILASATGSDSSVFFFFCPGFGVYLQDCKFVDEVLPVWVLFQYWFEESSGRSFLQALDTPYSYVLLKHLAPESGPRCD